jgi:hypothetical protein
VDIFSWDQFIANKFHLMYQDIAMRHLHELGSKGLRNEAWLKRLEEFIKVRCQIIKMFRHIKASGTG